MGTEEGFIELLRQFGPLVGIILFFIWRDWKREVSLSERIVTLEETQKCVLFDTLEKATKTIERNTCVMEQTNRMMEEKFDIMIRVNETLDKLANAQLARNRAS